MATGRRHRANPRRPSGGAALRQNDHLGFEVPCEYAGQEHRYCPDLIVVVNDGRGREDPLDLVLEVKGEHDEMDDAKHDTMRRLWVPAVNADGRLKRWGSSRSTVRMRRDVQSANISRPAIYWQKDSANQKPWHPPPRKSRATTRHAASSATLYAPQGEPTISINPSSSSGTPSASRAAATNGSHLYTLSWSRPRRHKPRRRPPRPPGRRA